MGDSISWGGGPSNNQRAAMLKQAQANATAKAAAFAPPPPVDNTAAIFREFARQATDRQIRQGKGRTNAFLSLGPPGAGAGEPYRAPGSKTTLGG